MNVTDTYSYSAFGITESSSGSSVNPFRFVGQWGYYDDGARGSQSGLLLLGVRYYSSEFGRFWSWLVWGNALVYEHLYILLISWDKIRLGDLQYVSAIEKYDMTLWVQQIGKRRCPESCVEYCKKICGSGNYKVCYIAYDEKLKKENVFCECKDAPKGKQDINLLLQCYKDAGIPIT